MKNQVNEKNIDKLHRYNRIEGRNKITGGRQQKVQNKQYKIFANKQTKQKKSKKKKLQSIQNKSIRKRGKPSVCTGWACWPPSLPGWGCGSQSVAPCWPAPHSGSPLERWFSQSAPCPSRSSVSDRLCLARRTLSSQWKLQEHVQVGEADRSSSPTAKLRVTGLCTAAALYLCL